MNVLTDEVRRFFSDAGKLGSRAAKSEGMKRFWAGMDAEARRAHLAKATAASLEARRKKREEKGEAK